MVEKIGMSEKLAMEISGHKARPCFERSHIVSLADIQESGKKAQRSENAQEAEAPQPNEKAKARRPHLGGKREAEIPKKRSARVKKPEPDLIVRDSRARECSGHSVQD